MAKRATLEEVREFANIVREAGGGNPIDALMPAVPEDMSQCLIALNLNFNCRVGLSPPGGRGARWWMTVREKDVRDRIAEALGVSKRNWQIHEYIWDEVYGGNEVVYVYGVLLPTKISQVAADFDKTTSALANLEDALASYEFDPDAPPLTAEIVKEIRERELSSEDRELIDTFWPYLEESVREAYELASWVNEDGSIVI